MRLHVPSDALWYSPRLSRFVNQEIRCIAGLNIQQSLVSTARHIADNLQVEVSVVGTVECSSDNLVIIHTDSPPEAL